jgi:hypothetical protein
MQDWRLEGMTAGKLNLSCVLDTSKILDASAPERFSMNCSVKSDDTSRVGDFSVSFSNVNGKGKVDVDMSKDLIGNLIMDGISIDGIIDGIGNFLL